MKKASGKIWLGNGLLLLAAAVWGGGFYAQDLVSGLCDSFTVGGVRFFMAGIFLILVILVAERRGKRRLFSIKEKRFHLDITKAEWVGGLSCGVLLCSAAVCQQIGISDATGDAAAASFITALYVIFVPLFGLFLRRFPKYNVWIGVGLALVGFYLLTANIHQTEPGLGGFFSALGQSGFRLAPGDAWVLVCAVLYAVHILVIDRFVRKADPLRLSCIQFFVASLLSWPFAFIFEEPSLGAIASAFLPLLYLGVLSGGVGYTLQMIGQQYADAAIAPMILSLESVFGALFVALFSGEYKTLVQYIGCGLVFIAVILAQLPLGSKKKSGNTEAPAAEETETVETVETNLEK